MNQANTTNNAGFLIRALANVTDTLIYFLVVLLPAYYFISQFKNLELIDPLTGLVNLVTYLIVGFFGWALLYMVYAIYFTAQYGGTLGKLLFGLKIVDYTTSTFIDYKTAFYRTFVGYMFSGAFLGLGFLRIINNPEKLAWHDELFNTKVVCTTGIAVGLIGFVLLIVIFGSLLVGIFNEVSSLSIFNRLESYQDAFEMFDFDDYNFEDGASDLDILND